MFWGCFSYNRKGPYHCWLPEIAAERREVDKALEDLNEALEPAAREAWELETAMRKMTL